MFAHVTLLATKRSPRLKPGNAHSEHSSQDCSRNLGASQTRMKKIRWKPARPDGAPLSRSASRPVTTGSPKSPQVRGVPRCALSGVLPQRHTLVATRLGQCRSFKRTVSFPPPSSPWGHRHSAARRHRDAAKFPSAPKCQRILASRRKSETRGTEQTCSVPCSHGRVGLHPSAVTKLHDSLNTLPARIEHVMPNALMVLADAVAYWGAASNSI